MFNGQVGTKVLQVSDGMVRLLNDTVTHTYSIGLRTKNDMQFKYISKELHDMLVKELAEQEGNS